MPHLCAGEVWFAKAWARVFVPIGQAKGREHGSLVLACALSQALRPFKGWGTSRPPSVALPFGVPLMPPPLCAPLLSPVHWGLPWGCPEPVYTDCSAKRLRGLGCPIGHGLSNQTRFDIVYKR